MLSVADQLEMASVHVARLASEHKAAEAKRVRQAEHAANARAKQWASRRGEPNHLRVVLLERLPKGQDQAIPIKGVMALFADYDFAPTGISSALSLLCKAGQAQRIGERFSYRYYVKP